MFGLIYRKVYPQTISIHLLHFSEFKYLSIIQKNLIFMHQIMFVGTCGDMIGGFFFYIVIKTGSSYFEIKIQNQKSVCPAIGLTTALLSTGMFYACGWGDEDGKPTYGYHGEDGCIKKNMFDGTLCLFLNLFFSLNLYSLKNC